MDNEETNNSEFDQGVHAEAETELANQESADQDYQTDDTTDPQLEDNSEDEGEEVEWEGKTYRVPKELKDGLLRHSDYTRKTQEVADLRKTVEAERQALAERQQAQEALITEHAKVKNLEEYVAYYERVDWDAAEEQNPETAMKEWRRYQQLKDSLNAARTELQTRESRLKEQQSQEREKALQETGATLAREIPGWSRELASQIVSTAAEYGFQNELLDEPDARVWKVFYALHEARRNQTKQATGERLAKQATTAPVKVVGAKSPPPSPLSDRASMDAWMAARNQQVRKG